MEGARSKLIFFCILGFTLLLDGATGDSNTVLKQNAQQLQEDDFLKAAESLGRYERSVLDGFRANEIEALLETNDHELLPVQQPKMRKRRADADKREVIEKDHTGDQNEDDQGSGEVDENMSKEENKRLNVNRKLVRPNLDEEEPDVGASQDDEPKHEGVGISKTIKIIIFVGLAIVVVLLIVGSIVAIAKCRNKSNNNSEDKDCEKGVEAHRQSLFKESPSSTPSATGKDKMYDTQLKGDDEVEILNQKQNGPVTNGSSKL